MQKPTNKTFKAQQHNTPRNTGNTCDTTSPTERLAVLQKNCSTCFNYNHLEGVMFLLSQRTKTLLTSR